MSRNIKSVAVLGAGTMGAGIAALCADNDCDVLLLDISKETAERGLDRILNGRPPALESPDKVSNIHLGSLEEDLDKIANYDWICEAIIEDLEIKRQLFARVEACRSDGSIVSSNTSGIRLREITRNMPDRLCKDIAITHFFNPVKLMHLLEIVPGENTSQDVIDSLANFCRKKLGKGIVSAKDTVNFIGNRVGCFWILNGLHCGGDAIDNGIAIEKIDALMSSPVGLPPTGLYGLVDLIGLDVMDLVAKNLKNNLSTNDLGYKTSFFPDSQQKMLTRGQLGRKSQGGFYRVRKLEDGSKLRETFDFKMDTWRDFTAITLDEKHSSLNVILSEDREGRLCWDIMGQTLLYAADLIPEISEDILNIDRAMRWGFAWSLGPFEMLDSLNPSKVIQKLESKNMQLPKMLEVLKNTETKTFYRNNGSEFLNLNGKYEPVPDE